MMSGSRRLLLSITFIIFCCTPNNEEQVVSEETLSSLANRQPVAELLRVPKDSIEKIMVVDSLVLVFPAHMQKGDPMLRVYEMGSFSKQRAFIPYGSGKGAWP